MRDVAMSRMEACPFQFISFADFPHFGLQAKVTAVEALQPKFDRRMAEVSGSVRAARDRQRQILMPVP